MGTKVAVTTTGAPAAAHTFGQGVLKNGVLQVSGQGAADPETGNYVGLGDVREQTRRTLANVLAVLTAGGASVEDVVMFRVYLTTRDDFAPMNEVYGEFVSAHAPGGVLPSRTTVIVGLPHPDMLVEIDALAIVDAAEGRGTTG